MREWSQSRGDESAVGWGERSRVIKRVDTLVAMHAESALMESVVVGDPDPEIAALEATMRSAQLNGDTDALDQLIDEDLLFTGPDGTVGTKAQDLDAHRSGVVRFRSHQPEELRIRRLGDDVAIANLRARLSVEVAGKLVSGTFRYTRIWARGRAGQWRVVGGHVSELSESPA
jgi:ketosteroid isomerase-like protein